MLSSSTVSPSPYLLLESSPEPSLHEDFEGSAELSLLGAFFICKMPNLAANGNSQQKRMVSSGWDIYEHFLSKRCEAGNLSVLPESSPAAVRQLNAKFQLGFCPWRSVMKTPSPCLRQPLFGGHTRVSPAPAWDKGTARSPSFPRRSGGSHRWQTACGVPQGSPQLRCGADTCCARALRFWDVLTENPLGFPSKASEEFTQGISLSRDRKPAWSGLLAANRKLLSSSRGESIPTPDLLLCPRHGTPVEGSLAKKSRANSQQGGPGTGASSPAHLPRSP